MLFQPLWCPLFPPLGATDHICPSSPTHPLPMALLLVCVCQKLTRDGFAARSQPPFPSLLKPPLSPPPPLQLHPFTSSFNNLVP